LGLIDLRRIHAATTIINTRRHIQAATTIVGTRRHIGTCPCTLGAERRIGILPALWRQKIGERHTRRRRYRRSPALLKSVQEDIDQPPPILRPASSTLGVSLHLEGSPNLLATREHVLSQVFRG